MSNSLSGTSIGDVFAVMFSFQFILIYQKIINMRVAKSSLISMEEVTKTVGDTDESGACCPPADVTLSCCKVEAIVSIDERGQMVLPKELRERAHIGTGEKLAVVSWEKDGNISCISLIKAEDLTEMVKNVLGPVMKEIL